MLDLTKVSKEKLSLPNEPPCPECGLLNKDVKWAVVVFVDSEGKQTYQAVCMPCVVKNGWQDKKIH